MLSALLSHAFLPKGDDSPPNLRFYLVRLMVTRRSHLEGDLSVGSIVAAKTISHEAQQPSYRELATPARQLRHGAGQHGWEADWVLDLPAADLAQGGEPVQQPGGGCGWGGVSRRWWPSGAPPLCWCRAGRERCRRCTPR